MLYKAKYFRILEEHHSKTFLKSHFPLIRYLIIYFKIGWSFIFRYEHEVLILGRIRKHVDIQSHYYGIYTMVCRFGPRSDSVIGRMAFDSNKTDFSCRDFCSVCKIQNMGISANNSSIPATLIL